MIPTWFLLRKFIFFHKVHSSQSPVNRLKFSPKAELQAKKVFRCAYLGRRKYYHSAIAFRTWFYSGHARERTFVFDLTVVITLKNKIHLVYYVLQIQDILHDDVFSTYTEFPGLLDYVESFVGPNIMGMHSMLINKPPGTSIHPPHQVSISAASCLFLLTHTRLTTQFGCSLVSRLTSKPCLFSIIYDWEIKYKMLLIIGSSLLPVPSGRPHCRQLDGYGES